MADLKSIGKAIGRVVTKYMEDSARKLSTDKRFDKDEQEKYKGYTKSIGELRKNHFSDNKR